MVMATGPAQITHARNCEASRRSSARDLRAAKGPLSRRKYLSVTQLRRLWLSYGVTSEVCVFAVTVVLVSCVRDHALTPPVEIPPMPTGSMAQAWITTADQTRLLSQEPDLAIFTGHDTSTTVLTVSASTKYQSMVGFGGAMTDASAYLIETKMSATQRGVLMQDFFGRSGIRLSFVRIPMGASDFSLSQYSYDDVGEGQTDSTLSHFSIAPDSAYKLPALKEAMSINPSITFLASP